MCRLGSRFIVTAADVEAIAPMPDLYIIVFMERVVGGKRTLLVQCRYWSRVRRTMVSPVITRVLDDEWCVFMCWQDYPCNSPSVSKNRINT